MWHAKKTRKRKINDEIFQKLTNIKRPPLYKEIWENIKKQRINFQPNII